MTGLRNTFASMLAAAALALVGACGNVESQNTPTNVAESFYEEMSAGNIEAAKALSTPETAAMLDYIAATHCTEMFHVIAAGGASDERVEGASARVRFVEGGGFSTVPLVKVGDDWKVDFATMMKAHMRPKPVGISL